MCEILKCKTEELTLIRIDYKSDKTWKTTGSSSNVQETTITFRFAITDDEMNSWI